MHTHKHMQWTNAGRTHRMIKKYSTKTDNKMCMHAHEENAHFTHLSWLKTAFWQLSQDQKTRCPCNHTQTQCGYTNKTLLSQQSVVLYMKAKHSQHVSSEVSLLLCLYFLVTKRHTLSKRTFKKCFCECDRTCILLRVPTCAATQHRNSHLELSLVRKCDAHGDCDQTCILLRASISVCCDAAKEQTRALADLKKVWSSWQMQSSLFSHRFVSQRALQYNTWMAIALISRNDSSCHTIHG